MTIYYTVYIKGVQSDMFFASENLHAKLDAEKRGTSSESRF